MRFLDRFGRVTLDMPYIGAPYKRKLRWNQDDVETAVTLKLRALDLIGADDVQRQADTITEAVAPLLSSGSETRDIVRHVVRTGALAGLGIARAEELCGLARPGYAHQLAIDMLVEVETSIPLGDEWRQRYPSDGGSSVSTHRRFGAECGYWLGRVDSGRIADLLEAVRSDRDLAQFRL